MFEKIKRFYSLGLWSEVMVLNAVAKNIITQAEADSILNV